MAVRGLNYVIETACQVWNMAPHRDVRVPPVIDSDSEPVAINALWTDYALRPSTTNLAFMVQCVSQSNIEQWKQRLSRYPIRAGLLVSDDSYILLQYIDLSGRLEEREIEPESLAVELAEPRSKLFTPRAIAEFRTCQLTLADLEESITERSLSFLLRQRAELDRAFQTAIQGVLSDVGLPQQRTHPQSYVSSRAEIAGHGIRVAIAFMAARILEDKGFFGSDLRIPTNDPHALLNRTVTSVNGFFKKALEESIPHLSDRVLQRLAYNLGSRVSFALVDHKDVGLLYERAIKELPNDVTGTKWSDLQRHYTPVALAERMLELLPLERLRPEERIIFDPAAGSGSLLLASTSRLAGMSDIPEYVEARKSYLAQHVAGNDLDQYADLVTQLRYTLARESLGQNVPFPFPSHFSHEDYEKLNKNNMGIKPCVIVANPPFAEDGNTQRAAKFIEKVLSWLEADSQFAFILPQSFLTASTHGIPNARKLLTENCRIFEVWQCPEGTVGIDASQDVAIILGSVGKPRIQIPTVIRAIFSRAKISDTRDNGFLGTTWITQINSDADWALVTAPPINITVPTIPLGNLFYVFNGVNPGKEGKIYKPLKECPPGINCKRNWRLKWRDENKLWADPAKVPEGEYWLRYGSEYLERPRLENADLFDKPKILVGRTVNRGSVTPLAAQLDTTGLCPDSAIFCILPATEVQKYNEGYENFDRVPEGWEARLDDWDRKNIIRFIPATRNSNQFSHGNLQINVLHPRQLFIEKHLAQTSAKLNEISLVLRVTYGAFAALLLGDIEGAELKECIEICQPDELNANIVKIPHHGAYPKNGDDLKDLFKTIDAELAVLSVGSTNTYGPYGHVVPELFKLLLNQKDDKSKNLEKFVCTEVTRTCVHSASKRAAMGKSGLEKAQRCAGEITICAETSGKWHLKTETEHESVISGFKYPACKGKIDC